jgi:cbb3-type cytochrome oxidase subunit 3
MLYLSLLAIFAMAATVSAGTIRQIVCPTLVQVIEAFMAIGPTMVLLMFLYGGVRYIYGADDPGVRKQAKSIVINSVIGGMLLILAVTWVPALFTGAGLLSC